MLGIQWNLEELLRNLEDVLMVPHILQVETSTHGEWREVCQQWQLWEMDAMFEEDYRSNGKQ